MTYETINDAMTMRTGGGPALGRIDQYELVRELGGGGFGTVYLAVDTVSGIEVAVKGLPPFVKNNREEMENVRSNFALVSRLHHPNIAAALVLHPAKDVSYSSEDVRQKLRVLAGDTLMVMEYAPGVTLSQWRKQFPDRMVPVDKALEIIGQVAGALDYAHARKIVHRDIKPANVMIETTAGGAVVTRVLDFGLAAEIRSSMGRVSREIHDTSGTRPYMAPEQWVGGRQGPGTDQYALAVLFYELVTGEVPFASVFDTGDPVVMMNVVGRERFDPQCDLPKPVRLALAKALAKKPEDRFASCVDFVRVLEGKARVPRIGADGRGKGVGKWIALFAVLAALCGAGWWWQHAQRQKAEQARILAERRSEAERRAEKLRIAADEKAEASRRALEDAERAKADSEREKQKEADAARKARDDERRAEAERQKAAEVERKAKDEAEAARQRELKRLQEQEKKGKVRLQLYSDLASVDTDLANFATFEHKEPIRAKLDALTASYKAAKAAFDSDDVDSAAIMAADMRKPCDEIKKAIPNIRSYFLAKAEVDAARAKAVESEAQKYASREYDAAEAQYATATVAAGSGDYARASAEIAKLQGRYEAVRVAALENPEAIFLRGVAAQKSRDNASALRFFSQAAEKKHAGALVNLGLFHLKGIATEKDASAAFDCFSRAAQMNNARAQYLLGGCYAKAIGAKYDKELSRLWMLMAKVNGDKSAADFLSKAGWHVSADEESAVRDILECGSSGAQAPAALRRIALGCYEHGRQGRAQ